MAGRKTMRPTVRKDVEEPLAVVEIGSGYHAALQAPKKVPAPNPMPCSFEYIFTGGG